jgi:phage/conjugal plasmid C-4 type zinc finger TraR family protein
MEERMADEADNAQLRTAQVTEAGIARVRQKLNAPGSARCEDCGEPIPALRRQSLPGAVTCVDCQMKREQCARHRLRRE